MQEIHFYEVFSDIWYKTNDCWRITLTAFFEKHLIPPIQKKPKHYIYVFFVADSNSVKKTMHTYLIFRVLSTFMKLLIFPPFPWVWVSSGKKTFVTKDVEGSLNIHPDTSDMIYYSIFSSESMGFCSGLQKAFKKNSLRIRLIWFILRPGTNFQEKKLILNFFGSLLFSNQKKSAL